MVIFGLNKKQITLFLLSVILIFILFYFELIHKTYIPYFENIHRSAKFLLDAGENPSVIYPYAKANIIAWSSKDYRNQFAGYVGYGWIRHYMKMFPDHPNVERIKALALEMNKSETMTTERQKNLSSIVIGF